MKTNFFLFLLTIFFGLNIYSQNDHYYESGLAYYENEKFTEAISVLTKAIEILPTYEAVKLKADSYHKIEDFKNAVEYYIQAEALNRFDTDLFTHRAAALLSMGELELALPDLKRALSLDPNNAEAHYYMGNWYFENFKLKQAIKSYDQAIELKSDYTAAVYMRAAAHAESHDFEKAEEDFLQAQNNDPTLVQAAYNIAMLKFDSEHYAEALEDFNRMEENGFTDNAEFYYFRGETKYFLKDTKSACLDYKRSGELGDEEGEEMYMGFCMKALNKKPRGKKKSYMEF